MLRCAAVRLPRERAAALARGCDKRTAGDVGYLVKTALADLGLALRPWRLLAEMDGDLVLVGAMNGPMPRARDLARLGCAAAPFDVPLVAGSLVAASLHCLPVHVQHGEERPDGRRATIMSDAAEGCPDPARVYGIWVRRRLAARVDGTLSVAEAFALEGDVKVAKVVEERVVRKFAGSSPGGAAPDWSATREPEDDEEGEWGTVPRPSRGAGEGDGRVARLVLQRTCRASLDLRVLDPEKARRVMAFGIGRGKAFGIGSLLPTTALGQALALAGSLVDEVAA